MKTLFIAIEGIEGVGKTTLAKQMVHYFEQKNKTCNLTREPGGTPLAEQLRALLKDPQYEVDPITELLMMFASRSHHIQHHIKPLLEKGTIVISDRYVAASYAYQGKGRGIKTEYLQQLDQMVCGDLQPDYTILVTAPVEVAMERVNKRSEQIDRFEKEQHQFFNDVQTRYLELAEKDERYIIIDGSASEEVVLSQLLTELDKICKPLNI